MSLCVYTYACTIETLLNLIPHWDHITLEPSLQGHPKCQYCHPKCQITSISKNLNVTEETPNDQSSKKLFDQTFAYYFYYFEERGKKKKYERDLHIHNVGHDVKENTWPHG